MKNSGNLTVLYTNTPNPIIKERIRAFYEYGLEPLIIFGRRKRSKLTLNFDAARLNHLVLEISDRRGYNVLKLLDMLKFYFNARGQSDVYYIVYPDMLFVGIFIKLTSIRKIKLIYEIQDLHSKNIAYRIIHSMCMLLCNKIFLTSPFFVSEFIFPLEKILKSKSFYISNAPDKITHGHLKKTKNESDNPTNNQRYDIGFIGNLRDRFQIDCIEYLLRETNFSVFQAGASDFSDELERLESRYKSKFFTFGSYSDDELVEVWSQVDMVWCVYPDTHNYRNHVARRLHECATIKKKIIISQSARGNVWLASKNYLAHVKLDPDNKAEWDEKINTLSVRVAINKRQRLQSFEDYKLLHKGEILNA